MKDRIFSLPIKNINFEEANEEGLRKVKLYVCKAGEVPSHKLFIEQKSIDDAKESLKNRPILTAYEVSEEDEKTDFKGHEMEYVITQNGNSYSVKIEYIEQPVGHISELENSVYTEEYEGENWVVAEGYLYEDYCEDAIKILEGNDNTKSVSMEIRVLDSEYNKDEDLTHIKSFRFKGVTILGEEHPPAIENAKIELFSQDNNFSEKFEEMLNRIEILENERRNKVNREDILNKYKSLQQNEKFEAIVNDDTLTNEQLEDKLFSLSVEDLKSRIREEAGKETYVETDWWGENYECKRYWLTDVLPLENIAILEDCQEGYKKYGIPYTINGDKIELDFENKQRYIRGDWRPFIDGADTEQQDNLGLEENINENMAKCKKKKEEFESLQSELKDVKSNFSDLNSEKTELENNNKSLEERIEKLEKLKETFEKKELETELDNVISKFESLKGIKGIETILDNKFEFTPESLEKELKVFAYDNGITLNASNNKKDETFSKVNGLLNSNIENDESFEKKNYIEERYGINLEKYKRY